MSDDIKVDDVIDIPVVVDEIEKTALDKGWKPKDQFEGDPKDWRDAKAFVEKGELLDSIHALKRQSKENKEIIEQLVLQQKAISEAAYKQAELDLRERHKNAVELGDVVSAGKVAQEMIDLHKKAPEAAIDTSKAELDAFIARNKDWFNRDTPDNTAMVAYADALEQKIHKDNPSLSAKEVLGLVEKTVKDKFGLTKGKGAEVSPVSAPRSAPSAAKRETTDGLPKFQQIMIDKFKRTIKGFDEQAYIKQIRSIGEKK